MGEGTGLSASDVALLNDGGLGNNSFIWLFAILALMGGGFNWGNNGFTNAIGYENLATQAQVDRGFDNQNSMANQRDILAAVTSGTAQAVAATLQKARDQGIVVVTHEASDILDSVDYDMEAFDNDYFGTLYGQYLAEAMGGEGQWFGAVGGLGMTTHMQWFNSCVKYLEENYPDMELVNPDGIPGEEDNNEQTAYDLALQAIAAYPDLKGLMDTAASSNGMALALEENGRTDIKLVGLATPSQGGAYIEDGTQYVGLCWRPADAGYTTVEIAYKILKGEEITSDTTFTKPGYETVTVEGNLVTGNAPLVFTAENIGDYAGTF